tara:strand:- start:6673 stop:7545 length:873 start_codon:yes stop_codon:yes gene_type:complete
MVKLLGTQEVRISDIDVSGRMRPVSELAVVSLMASLQEIGLQSEIQLRKVRHQGGRLKLIAGAHRIEAHIRLGCTSISAKIWDCTDDWAEMAEIDDNLAHAELSPLDLSVFLARRKVVYERQYPETKRATGEALAAKRWNASDIMSVASDTMSFCQSVAEQKAMSERQIRRLVAAGEALDQEAIALLRLSPNRVTLSDLQTLGKCGDAKARRAICEALSRGESKNAAAALKAHKAPPGQKAISTVDRQYGKIDEAWIRASKAAKRQFVDRHAAELRALLLDAREEADDAS